MAVTRARRWTNLTRVYVGVLLVRVAFFGAETFLSAKPQASVIARDQMLWIILGVAVGFAWLHRAWARIPRPQRQAYDGQRVDPDEAIWKLFIPVYGVFYWLFVANTGLCGAVERQLQRHRARSVSVPSTLGFIACLVQLVPLANLVLSPLLWGMFMARMDAAQAEVEQLDPEAPEPEPIGWLKAAGMLVGALIAIWAMMILSYFAIWRFLTPDAPAM